jgi:hypothetical protein
MKRKPFYVTGFAIGLALILASAALATREHECAGNVCLSDDGGISPVELPRHGKAPVTASIFAEIASRDGSHPPALKTVEMEVDRTIAIDAVGLPTCRLGQIVARSTADAKRACGEAVVGSGSAEVEVSFPEQAPFSSTGPIVLFNGGVQGKTTYFLLHAYVDVPAPTAIVTRVSVARIHKGRFGLLMRAQVPKIAGGAGSPTKFRLKIGRRYAYQGRRKSFLTAGCPTGSWVTRGHASFADGTAVGLTHLFTCTPRG